MDKIFFQNHIFFKFLDTFSALFFNISIPSFKPAEFNQQTQQS